MKSLHLILPVLPIMFLVGCAVGPDYQRTAIDSSEPPPTNWQWQKADPKDAAPRSDWWNLYSDPELARLEDLSSTNNQDLKEAVARVEKARAQAHLNGAAFFPDLTLNPQADRERLTGNNPQFTQVAHGVVVPPATVNSLNVPVDLSYEIDLWGRVRKSFESSRDLAQAATADMENVLLTMHADVAIDYFTLREYDAEREILEKTVSTRTKSLEIAQTRLKAGRATSLDVEQAKTELANSQADLSDILQNRAETQDALAVLCGQEPSTFKLADSPLPTSALPPEVPVGLPSSLLERRPDVAEAERTMASKNAQIGVAYAAYFPTISLTGQYGYFSASASDLFTKPSSVWSLGPSVSVPLFNGGQTTAQVNSAKADYEGAVADYRGVVLGAFRDVEDALAQRQFLKDRVEALGRAVESAQIARQLSEERYRSGTVDYFEVTEAQRTELNAQREQVQTVAQRLYANIRLIKSLGGGWDISAIGQGVADGVGTVDAGNEAIPVAKNNSYTEFASSSPAQPVSH